MGSSKDNKLPNSTVGEQKILPVAGRRGKRAVSACGGAPAGPALGRLLRKIVRSRPARAANETLPQQHPSGKEGGGGMKKKLAAIAYAVEIQKLYKYKIMYKL